MPVRVSFGAGRRAGWQVSEAPQGLEVSFDEYREDSGARAQRARRHWRAKEHFSTAVETTMLL